MTSKIHPSAIVEDGAVLGADVEIGPYSVIGSSVRLGYGVRLASHVVVTGNTEIGPRTVVHAHAVLGGSSQFRNPPGGDAESGLRIGADNVTLNNAMTSQPQIVQIEPTDSAFKTRGCQPWQLTDAAVPPNQIPPWLAQLQLRRDLDSLNGLAGQSGNGQLPPY